MRGTLLITKICLSVFIALLASQSLASKHICTSETSYIERSKLFKCPSREIYHCGLLTNGSIAEFCAKERAFLAQRCPLYDLLKPNDPIFMDCKTSNCPESFFYSSELYRYPICYDVLSGPENWSTFVSKTNDPTQPRTSKLSQTVSSVSSRTDDVYRDHLDLKDLSVTVEIPEKNTTENQLLRKMLVFLPIVASLAFFLSLNAVVIVTVQKTCRKRRNTDVIHEERANHDLEVNTYSEIEDVDPFGSSYIVSTNNRQSQGEGVYNHLETWIKRHNIV